MKDINIRFIPHEQHRPEAGITVGDYWETETSIEFRISSLPDERHSELIAIHELVEKILTRHAGVKDSDIDAFDSAYEGEDEPGDDPKAPYHIQHGFASAAERMVAAELGVNWKEYDDAIERRLE